MIWDSLGRLPGISKVSWNPFQTDLWNLKNLLFSPLLEKKRKDLSSISPLILERIPIQF